MSIFISSRFKTAGVPTTGLSPTVTIREVAGKGVVVLNAPMNEVGSGFYRYEFIEYEATTCYVIEADGGDDGLDLRYQEAMVGGETPAIGGGGGGSPVELSDRDIKNIANKVVKSIEGRDIKVPIDDSGNELKRAELWELVKEAISSIATKTAKPTITVEEKVIEVTPPQPSEVVVNVPIDEFKDALKSEIGGLIKSSDELRKLLVQNGMKTAEVGKIVGIVGQFIDHKFNQNDKSG